MLLSVRLIASIPISIFKNLITLPQAEAEAAARIIINNTIPHAVTPTVCTKLSHRGSSHERHKLGFEVQRSKLGLL